VKSRLLDKSPCGPHPLQRVARSQGLYDTLFVELGDREQLPLATFDKKVLTTYPDIAKRPKDLM